MENKFKNFMEKLKKALVMIDEKYINVSIHKLPKNRYRERVYCYELYHQLRKILGDDYQYMLDGELDKRAHPIIAKYLGPKIPDFVVHYRGEMDENLAIIEVKTIKSVKDNISKLEKDLDKIIDFIEEAEYHYGLMLIYSNGRDKLNDNIIEAFKKKTKAYSEKIFLVWHPEPNREPELIK